jgi:hypothetical protein
VCVRVRQESGWEGGRCASSVALTTVRKVTGGIPQQDKRNGKHIEKDKGTRHLNQGKGHGGGEELAHAIVTARKAIDRSQELVFLGRRNGRPESLALGMKRLAQQVGNVNGDAHRFFPLGAFSVGPPTGLGGESVDRASHIGFFFASQFDNISRRNRRGRIGQPWIP